MVSAAGSTAAVNPPSRPQVAGTVIAVSACTRRRSLAGITAAIFASARTEDSETPATAEYVAADCRATATATASSSSITSGGSAAPAASW